MKTKNKNIEFQSSRERGHSGFGCDNNGFKEDIGFKGDLTKTG